MKTVAELVESLLKMPQDALPCYDVFEDGKFATAAYVWETVDKKGNIIVIIG